MKTILIDVNAVLKTAGCLSDDDTRTSLQSHRLEKNKTITTDGRTMMIHEADNELEEPIAIRLPVNEIKKACMKGKRLIIDRIPFEYEEGKDFGTLSLPSTAMRINCPIEVYPNYMHAIPQYETVTPCHYGIDPELLAQFGEPVYCLSCGSYMNPVLVFPLSGNSWMGVIMPMRTGGTPDTAETYKKFTGRTIEEKTELKEAQKQIK